MSKTLNEIRVQIDSIDNQVHDLLMERAALVSSVAAAKRKEGAQVVQPAREAMMMRRLLARHSGVLPRETVIRIWRELVGSVALLQSGFSVVVFSETAGCAYWDMAKNYFGSSVPMKRIGGIQNTISVVRDEDDIFAVMPWPELNEHAPWWVNLFGDYEGGNPLSIICALPYGVSKPDGNDVFERAVVVSKVKFMPSDDDVSFIGLELDSTVSRARVMDCATQAGFDVLGMSSGSLAHNEDAKVHMLEVCGYYERGAVQIVSLKSHLGDTCLYCDVMGGYPVVPDIYDTTSQHDGAA